MLCASLAGSSNANDNTYVAPGSEADFYECTSITIDYVIINSDPAKWPIKLITLLKQPSKKEDHHPRCALKTIWTVDLPLTITVTTRATEELLKESG